MTPNPLPLAGWSGWRWSGLVLIGRNPAGAEFSLGEVCKEDGRIFAVLNHPVAGHTEITARVGTVQFARKTIMEWVREFGGVADSAPKSEAGAEPGVDAPDSASSQSPTSVQTDLSLAADRKASCDRVVSGTTQDTGATAERGLVAPSEEPPSTRDRLLELVMSEPGITGAAAAAALSCSPSRVRQLAATLKLLRIPLGRGPSAGVALHPPAELAIPTPAQVSPGPCPSADTLDDLPIIEPLEELEDPAPNLAPLFDQVAELEERLALAERRIRMLVDLQPAELAALRALVHVLTRPQETP